MLHVHNNINHLFQSNQCTYKSCHRRNATISMYNNSKKVKQDYAYNKIFTNVPHNNSKSLF